MRRFLAFGVVLSIATVGFAEAKPVGKACPAAGKQPAAGPKLCSHPGVCDIVEWPDLNRKVNECVDLALGCVKGLCKEDVFVTYLEICGAPRPCEDKEKHPALAFGHVHGFEPQIPSGVIQPFVAAHLLSMEPSLSDDLQEDLANMLKHGDFEATNHLIDVVTDTESGPELEKWMWENNPRFDVNDLEIDPEEQQKAELEAQERRDARTAYYGYDPTAVKSEA